MGFPIRDRFVGASSVADAVLFEGYVLYPYRASARKNQLRWQFGVLVPGSYSERDPSERSFARTECLAILDSWPAMSALNVRCRFLQVQRRTAERSSGTNGFQATDMFKLDDKAYVTWDEAIDRIVDVPELMLSGPDRDTFRAQDFNFSETVDCEPIYSGDGSVAGRFIRTTQSLDGTIRVDVAQIDQAPDSFKISVRVENTTGTETEIVHRDGALSHSLVALHMMLALEGGRFISSVDPPEEMKHAAKDCCNEGLYPVLVSQDDVVLSSPIILYDHPQIAVESPGDLYDSTEIDEILALRVLTLTDEEKLEARATDPRSEAVINRCDDMSPEAWSRLHGSMRQLGPSDEAIPTFAEWRTSGPETSEPDRPWWDPGVDSSVDPFSDSVMVAGVELRKGTRVRLHPSRRADAQDLFLRGLVATVAGIFRDVDGNDHVAVTIEDDPAAVELAWQGRFLYFYPDEIEPLSGQIGLL
ncbi:MAG: hypothetical protein WAM97_17495 [Acidimicrobiales bacterium]